LKPCGDGLLLEFYSKLESLLVPGEAILAHDLFHGFQKFPVKPAPRVGLVV